MMVRLTLPMCPIRSEHALVCLDNTPITVDQMGDTWDEGMPLEVKCLYCGEEFLLKGELLLEHGATEPSLIQMGSR